MIGPDASDRDKRHAGNGLDCQSCHLHANMPFGTTAEAPVLLVQDAFDVAAFIIGQ